MTHALVNIVALAALALATGILIAEVDLNGARIIAALRGRPMR
jgi:hypothetical protein